MYGEKLKISRKNKKMSLVKVAMLLNLTHPTISKYENNILEPSLDTLKKLCILYEVSADYVLGLPQNMNYPKR